MVDFKIASGNSDFWSENFGEAFRAYNVRWMISFWMSDVPS